MALSPAQQAELARANRPGVERAFARVANYWLTSEWLPANNRYKKSCIRAISRDRRPPQRTSSKQLSDYVAASSLTHCLDGWAYFGRALSSFLCGDIDASRHLAYYAELRAAMSTLATEGIGVFDKEHCVVIASGKAIPIPPPRKPAKPTRAVGSGTHQFVWDALQYWAQQGNAARLLFRLVEAGGLQLQAWLNAFATVPAVHRLLAQSWLQQWGLDLRRLAEDRNSRNLVSYRPTAFTSPPPVSADHALQFARDVWELCAPGTRFGFQLLDRAIVRGTLEYAFRSGHPFRRTHRQAKVVYERHIRSMLHQLAPTEMTQQQWLAFLTYNSTPSIPQLFVHASGRARPSDPLHPSQVLSRAAMLLRIATGACRLLLSSLTSFAGTNIAFWWQQLCIDRGIRDNSSASTPSADLWDDVSNAIDDLASWRQSMTGPLSYWRVWDERARSTAILGTCERIGLWGVGL